MNIECLDENDKWIIEQIHRLMDENKDAFTKYEKIEEMLWEVFCWGSNDGWERWAEHRSKRI